MLRKLWNDEAGFLVSAELVLVATILVIGMIVGLASLRDAVVTELADVGQAISQIDQSYEYTGILGHLNYTAGSLFIDLPDFCDLNPSTAGQQSRCVVFNSTAASESGAGFPF